MFQIVFGVSNCPFHKLHFLSHRLCLSKKDEVQWLKHKMRGPMLLEAPEGVKEEPSIIVLKSVLKMFNEICSNLARK
jgi:hypothetical protein